MNQNLSELSVINPKILLNNTTPQSNAPISVDLTKYKYISIAFRQTGETNIINCSTYPISVFKTGLNIQSRGVSPYYALANYVSDYQIKVTSTGGGALIYVN